MALACETSKCYCRSRYRYKRASPRVHKLDYTEDTTDVFTKFFDNKSIAQFAGKEEKNKFVVKISNENNRNITERDFNSSKVH